MPLLNITLPKLHTNQAAIKHASARFQVLACGRRFGKTELAKFLLAEYVIRGFPVAYFAPSYKMTKETFRGMRYMCRELITRSSENEGRMEFVTRGSLDFWSLSTTSGESVRGRKYRYVVIDEAAMVPNGDALFNEVIRPLLVDMAGGALFCSTPKGRNWFYDIFMRGMDDSFTEWKSWNFPTLSNPYIAESEVEAARLTTPERSFRQEYLAEFVEDAGSVFRQVSRVSVLKPVEQVQAGTGAKYVMGVDWGRDVDFTVISVFDATTRKQVYLDRFNQVGYRLQRDRLKAVYQKFQPTLCLIEENSIGTINIEELQRDGLAVTPFYTSYTSKSEIIDALAIAIEQEQVQLLDHEVQKHELQAYSMHRTPNGYYIYGAPPGGHDDCVMATAIAWRGVLMSDAAGTIMRQMSVNW
jgi:hypothetical protein